ncbi:hypothetical protein N7492_007857 [Penicillium capsulatum]|uniref:Phosphoesterase n=1 Tax=Penicillium capsulatum TaxID=69766 RepID=A0A9W9I4T8_9EURO|nr:hypothetical protein N7492_007857 [Penicillium capsulatum]KAJ6117688.1 hypothetical protein N7512_007413 [Penicillium capsulatum]
MHFDSSFLVALLAYSAIQVAALPQPPLPDVVDKGGDGDLHTPDSLGLGKAKHDEQATHPKRSPNPDDVSPLEYVVDAVKDGVTKKPAHGAGSDESIKNMKKHIKKVVVLVMENRSLDNILGGQTLEGLDNPINNKGDPFCNYHDVDDKSGRKTCAEPKEKDSILQDPNHSVSGNNMEFYGTFTPDNDDIQSGKLKPKMNGFVQEQLRLHDDSDANNTELASEVMSYYPEKHVPVLTKLVKEYCTFNRWFSSFPGPTAPNRAFIVSGTSRGRGDNNDDFDADTHGLTHMSIFEALGKADRSWKNYYVDSSEQMVDAWYFDWVFKSGNDKKAVHIKEFYADAKAGKLPDFSYIEPSCCGDGTNSMHPTGRVSDGEEFIRDVYQALRASPQWDQTLFVLTFDETGGFHDHVPPPTVGRPDYVEYEETTPNDEKYTFKFDRLGGRVPTLLISPWVAKGKVVQDGTDRNGTSVPYSATSLLRTLGYLWDFQPFNHRIHDSPSFDHLILSEKRDTPESLPKPASFK